MKVLIACEFSGTVRDAFVACGHDAVSCDLEQTIRPGRHIQGDVREMDLSGYDILIAHPPCTYLATSANRWLKEDSKKLTVGERLAEQEKALEFVKWLMDAPVPRIAIENPQGIIGTRLGVKVSQTIHPWQYGHGEVKRTCLWLKNLPKLVPTDVVEGREARMHRSVTAKGRAQERSKTYQGVAMAMARQWGSLPECDVRSDGQLSFLRGWE